MQIQKMSSGVGRKGGVVRWGERVALTINKGLTFF